MDIKGRKISKILVFQLNWLGDILFSFPFLRALALTYPGAEITCAVVPRYSALLSNNPWVSSIIELSDKRGFASLIGEMDFILKSRKERYDVCFFLKPSRTKAIMAVFAGIRERVGFSGKRSFLTSSVELPSGEIHRSDQISSLLGAMGATVTDGTYEYFFTAHEQNKAKEILKASGSTKSIRVALNPGGNWAPKRWPKERFIELAKKILDKFEDIEIVITGAMKDVSLGKEIVSAVNSRRCYSVAGKTGIKEIAAIFKSCALVISADSGPLHLASAAGTRTIGLFGPTSPNLTGPRGRGLNVVVQKKLDCVVPCYVEKCEKGYECMHFITAEEVFDIFNDVMSRV